MKSLKILIASFIVLFSSLSFAADASSTPALRGYDAVSYHTIGRPVMGNGSNASLYKGESYLFINKEHKELFDANPEKYVPAYGGWCAYGVSAGKKFHGDPLVWKIVDGKLYLNLSNKIQALWSENVQGYINGANEEWEKIKDKSASSL